MIATYKTGTDQTQPPLMIVHGLYGSARNWAGMARRLSDTRTVITVDQRNHGESPWYPTHSYPEMANDLAEVIENLPGGQVDLVGHSMGGKAAMALALHRPQLISRLVVADIAPVAYAHTQGHYITAMRAVDLANVGALSAADKQLAPHVDDPGVRAFLLQSLDRKARRWRLHLDALETDMPKIVGWPEIEGEFAGPTLFLSGGASDYVLPEHRPSIRALFPKARFARIPGAGHWLHADRPDAFEAAVRTFLRASPQP